MNNFGIVTKFILKSHPKGGLLTYAESQLDAIKTALVNFQQKSDTKAEVIVARLILRFSISVAYFYDAPTPSRVLDEFLNIPLPVVIQKWTLGAALEPTTKAFLTWSDSAYPPDRSHVFFLLPCSIWSNPSLDETMALRYATYQTQYTPPPLPMGRMLRQIRAAIDPEDVMGLAGGWKF
ncbi:hypothetical protein BJV77DRAFT_1012490 [Russula vinacea]|nr:hypothetical protein BJV77DRAFT_1012490 [Russula vinacea]